MSLVHSLQISLADDEFMPSDNEDSPMAFLTMPVGKAFDRLLQILPHATNLASASVRMGSAVFPICTIPIPSSFVGLAAHCNNISELKLVDHLHNVIDVNLFDQFRGRLRRLYLRTVPGTVDYGAILEPLRDSLDVLTLIVHPRTHNQSFRFPIVRNRQWPRVYELSLSTSTFDRSELLHAFPNVRHIRVEVDLQKHLFHDAYPLSITVPATTNPPFKSMEVVGGDLEHIWNAGVVTQPLIQLDIRVLAFSELGNEVPRAYAELLQTANPKFLSLNMDAERVGAMCLDKTVFRSLTSLRHLAVKFGSALTRRGRYSRALQAMPFLRDALNEAHVTYVHIDTVGDLGDRRPDMDSIRGKWLPDLAATVPSLEYISYETGGQEPELYWIYCLPQEDSPRGGYENPNTEQQLRKVDWKMRRTMRRALGIVDWGMDYDGPDDDLRR
ncbi:hypothetical protein GLOTRDRAFT_95499 [Gloeophyllum trabeum ATCC 11539]|uniref:Uncharacterized protein n=1 Tax=Gloeophyllum trabeum (strain ATCC 11539 / FP-39264 / Madison 617) TaxID=670483 RepID=S7REG5_GLOTA|nr:uncharacterized protein GLOTRDRAFT_95499 [Gloeophyllum trabeum ATCC 11539]EPQ52620.1 hypothetical protein GLOTRDRAFT_95499 [Gloeophyllum trabeum ATCC 11539]